MSSETDGVLEGYRDEVTRLLLEAYRDEVTRLLAEIERLRALVTELGGEP